MKISRCKFVFIVFMVVVVFVSHVVTGLIRCGDDEVWLVIGLVLLVLFVVYGVSDDLGVG
jgi:hypothetical protein